MIPSLSYDEFPAREVSSEGMQRIAADTSLLNIRWHQHVVYAVRDDRPLHLEILEPYPFGRDKPAADEVLDQSLPTIVFIQGSGWHAQDILSAVPRVYPLAEQGYTVALVEYRPTEEGAYFPSQVHDAKEAVRFLRRHASRYSVDPDRIVLFGTSSGGHTALLAAFTGDEELIDPEEPEPGESCSINAVVSFYAPVHIGQMHLYPTAYDHTAAESPRGYLIGRKNVLEHPELVEPTVITNYVTASRDLPPTLLIHGNRDRTVPFEQGVMLYEHMRDCGKAVEFYCLDQADHGGMVFFRGEPLTLVLGFIRRILDR